MSDAVVIAMLVAIPPTVAACASLVVAVRSNKRLDKLHIQINSRMDQLLKAVAAQERGEGRAEGIEAERIRPREGVL